MQAEQVVMWHWPHIVCIGAAHLQCIPHDFCFLAVGK